MKELLQAAELLRKARRKLSQGQYSREPLQLIRIEWKRHSVECDWLMRPPDPWDVDLPADLARQNQTHQALKDALSLRDAIFDSFPAARNADLCMYRVDAEEQLELVMTGSVSRSNEVLQRVASLVMRARLCGFNFTLGSGGLESLRSISLGCT
jgi:hypothetical protein